MYTYDDYRSECIASGSPPLTRKEWEREGCLTYAASVKKSEDYARIKDEELMITSGLN